MSALRRGLELQAECRQAVDFRRRGVREITLGGRYRGSQMLLRDFAGLEESREFYKPPYGVFHGAFPQKAGVGVMPIAEEIEPFALQVDYIAF